MPESLMHEREEYFYNSVSWSKFVRIWVLIPIILGTSLVTHCSNQTIDSGESGDIYLPPTLALSATSPRSAQEDYNNQPSQLDLRPTSTPSCTNDLWFLSDLTIPDGTIVSPGEDLDKRWQVQNSGTCNWNEEYIVKLIAGPNMGLPNAQALVPALGDTKVIIRMLLTAPTEPGNYRSAWQAYDPQGNPFGHPFFIDIVVK